MVDTKGNVPPSMGRTDLARVAAPHESRGRARGRVRLALTCVLAQLACGPPKPPVEVDGEAVIREALLDGSQCYAQRPEYCIRDEEYLRAAIDHALARRSDGKMPKYEREVKAIVGSAKTAYRDSTKAPVGLAKVEALVQAHYDDPPVDTSLVAGVVSAELGALPGKLVIRGRGQKIALGDSDLVEKFWWAPAEAGRRIAALAKAHPDAKTIRIQIHIEKGSSGKELVYRYFPKSKTIVMGELGEDSVYVSDPVSLETMAAGSLQLERSDMDFCSRPRTPDGEGPSCPWRDSYAEAVKAAKK